MMYAMLMPLLAVATPMPDGAVTVTAHLEADTLAVGEEYALIVDVRFGDGFSASAAGIPAPILQIDVPKSVQLSGKVLKGYRALSRHEFLQEPFERLLKTNPARIAFTLRSEPVADEPLGLNVLVYLSSDTGDDAWFVRRRLELPLSPGATAKTVSPAKSDWGKERVLQIGDKATPFSLPTADNKKISLRKYLGKKNIIVTMYRAFW